MDDKDQLEIMHGMLEAHTQALAIHSKAMAYHCECLKIDTDKKLKDLIKRVVIIEDNIIGLRVKINES